MKESPFGHGYAIVDPDMPAKVAHDAAAMKKRGLVQLCTTVDAWSPEAQKYDLGRRCLEAILSQPGWTVRILTKNAAVTQDFDFIKKYRDRVLVGLSLTGTAQQNDIVKVVEPYASSISERMAAMVKARKLGLRTYGMLCPLLPGIANGFDQVSELIRFVKKCGAEDACLHGYAQRKNPDGSRGAKNVGL
jgi:DNA repair photolyase